MVCDAKEIIEGERVYLWKRCLHHGVQRVLLSDDADYFRRCREVFLKKPEQVFRHNTGVRYGCPYDCGICPDHEQHGCVCVLEITDHCNLSCPTCFASSGPDRVTHRSLDQVRKMLDLIVMNEHEPDVVQISGGEPTLHPAFFEILDECRTRPIRHLMVNTNGIRIAKEEGFAERLAGYAPSFEIYLQFDGLDDSATKTLRGAELSRVKRRALDKLNELNLATTLVATLRRGVNDMSIGEILSFAAAQRCVRGVTLQPVHDAGRNTGFTPETDRLTLSEVRRRVIQDFDVFEHQDVIPVPCHPDCVAMAYAIRGSGDDYRTLSPLTRYVPAELLIEGGRNTIIYEGDAELLGNIGERIFSAFSTGHGPKGAARALGDLLCCLPRVDSPELGYDRVFRVIIMQFLDRHTMDLRSIRKSCVHVATPDGTRLIPFDAYNVLYRDELESTVLAPLRRRVQLPWIS